MASTRDQILGGIRRSLRRGPLTGAAEADLRRRLAEPGPGLVPTRVRCSHAELVELFAAMAREVAATVESVSSLAAVPAAVADWVARLTPSGGMAVAPALERLDWASLPMPTPHFGAALPEDAVGIAAAFAGVAETGTLVLLSGPDTPTSLNFLPDNHIVVLRSADVTGTYEEVWGRLRRAGALPRTVNMITGPSRTGDIEQTMQLGAHGPRRLHVLMVDNE